MLVDEKRGRGRPPHEPTDELRAKVKQVAGIGASNVDIARYLRVSIDTLSKYYADELERAPWELNLAVGNAAFYQAVGLKITVGDGPHQRRRGLRHDPELCRQRLRS